MTRELRALTSVRGIAAWAVVLYHIRLSIAGLDPAIVATLAKGYLAVDFFFLLSGFVIWLSWSERLRGGGWRSVPGFLQRRVARVWPLHLFVLAGGVLLATLLAATGRRDAADFPFAELPLHVTLLQNWGFTSALSWNDPAWSISCELGAYLLFPWLAFAIDWRRVPSWAVVAAVAALLATLHGIFARAGAPTLGTDIARLGLLRCVLEFGAGTAIAALWWRWREAPVVAAVVAGAVATGLAAALLAGWLPETLGVPALFAAMLLALALTSGWRGNLLDARWPHALGEVSYATYLGHFLLWFVFKLALVDDAHAVPVVLVALYLAMVLAMSFALYHLIERPAQRWVNALILPGARPTIRQAAR